ncbi:hypothetical protein [Synechocystis sp. LKSZ1]|uniref:hypothetical protein n=1 Tax=Synechocystis sp. LKSZ1 TaxID=3144951 RepID=UPI00336C13C2
MTLETTLKTQTETLIYPQLPLAVYREIAAHLRQVEGIATELLPQTATQFDYAQSQVGGLRLSYPTDLGPQGQQILEDIINYYGQRYGQPERHRD